MKKAKYKKLTYKDILGDFQATVTGGTGTSLTETNFNQMIDTFRFNAFTLGSEPNYSQILRGEWLQDNKSRLQQERHKRAQHLAFWLKNKRK